MPQVIRTDNTKGEMVVEIEIKKGTTKDKLQFIVSGFKKQTKKDLNNEDLKVIKLTTIATQVEDVVSIETAKDTMIKVADLTTIDQREQAINVADLRYAIVSAKQGSSDISAKFRIVGSELKLEVNKTLEAGNIEFVVSAKLTSSSDVPINSDSFIVIITPSISKVKKIVGKETAFVSIETSSKILTITNLITTNQRGQAINVVDLRYAIVSATQWDGNNISDKFEISNGLLMLKNDETLEVGDISFIVSAKLISSSDVPINSSPFIATISSPIKSVEIRKIPFDHVKLLRPINTPINIATIVTKDKNEKIISAINLDYEIVSIKRKGLELEKDDFQIDGSVLRLKANKTLNIGDIIFVVSVKLINFVNASINSIPFTITHSPIIIATVLGAPISDFVSIEITTPNTLKVADLTTIDQREQAINVADLRYAIVSAKQGSSDISAKFKIVGSELKLEANKTLEAGNIEFVVSAKLTSSSDVPINSDSFIVIITPSISKVKKIVGKETAFVSIETSSKIFTITNLITTNQRGQAINVVDLRYAIVSATQGDGNNISDKFEISNGLLMLKSGETLEDGDISFIVSAKLTSSSDVPINSDPFIATISSPIKSVEISKIPFDHAKILRPVNTPINIATIVTKDKNEKIISAINLDYEIVYCVMDGQYSNYIDASDKFEISNGLLKLKSGKTLEVGYIDFIVSAQLKGAIAMNSQEFTVFVKPTIKSIEAKPISINESILPTSKDINIAILVTRSLSDRVISGNSLKYKIISAQQGESKTDVKQKFIMWHETLRLKSGEILGIGNIKFEISVQYYKTKKPELITFIVPLIKIG